MAWTNDPLNTAIKIKRIHVQELRDNLDLANNVVCPVECPSLHTTQQIDYFPSYDAVKDDTIDIAKYDTDNSPRYITNDAALNTVENASNCPSYCPTYNGAVQDPYESYSGGCSGHYKTVYSQHENGVNSANL